ncbi:HD domain-containing protein [Deinococcus aquiradiocola]|uniref:tRNA nucleotidyltransferase n=1 Tax=Deinococcus aquiradiocola TaxID=393059 RepID=A0A917P4W8_9DEIO|nr:HD domain-containing protein [Deinococcus aquiradiocola]GGJ61729.1 tRNA nucleotidyltransferase [Deinococcus aquiradiocola]
MFRRSPVPPRLRPLVLNGRWPDGAVLVGGAVRDVLRGVTPKDWDWAAPDPHAAAERLAGLLGGAVFALDPVRGYYRVVAGAQQHDVVPRPDLLEDDLWRRDFTVNALALHADGRVTDPTGGRRDLRAGRLRMVREENLRGDPLRLLRAARLSVTLGFSLEPATRAAVQRLAGEGLPLPAPERARDELNALLRHEDAARGVLLLRDLGLLRVYLPELLEGEGMRHGDFHHLDVLGHAAEALHQLLGRFPDAPLTLRWAALLHDVGKPRTRGVDGDALHFHGHERVGADLAREMLTRLRFPAGEVERVTALVAAHMLPLPQSEREARRFVHRRRDLLPDLLALMLADREAARGPRSSEHSRFSYRQGMDRVLAALEDQPGVPAPLLDGRQVMALLDLPPGPQLGEALRALAEARALGDVTDEAGARTWLLAWANGKVQAT